MFESKRQRFSPQDFLVGDKDILFNKKRKNDYYDVHKAEEALQKVKRSMPTAAFSPDVGVNVEAKNGLPKLIKSIVTQDQGKQTLLYPHYPGSLEDKARKA